eukprot:CAMPEP_0115468828 /NCGR_PEP_ID=MMETSP0271-20121206/51160_1 /TAXON_ID=71861 /ORGANISM="Scrippsiella trochoidea, Strain CCMP3099" /LENGTH=980 /DNA_ID=CAMNT_0002895897 /DNA_START=81 /DNA_END=3021 /DNA_ORIENTATION=-
MAVGDTPRDQMRRRTLQLLKEAEVAEAEAEVSRTPQQMWKALQRKLKVVNQFQHIVGDNPDSVVMQEDMMTLPIFSTVSVDFAKLLSMCIDVSSYSPGTEIVTEGTQANALIWVLRGSVRVVIDGEDVKQMSPGQYFGETALLGLEQEWTGTLRADSPCTVGRLPREAFVTCLASFQAEREFFNSITRDFARIAQEEHKARTCDLLKGLSEESLSALEKVLPRRLFFPGETFIHEGSPGDELFIFVRGRLNITLAGRQIRRESRLEAPVPAPPPGALASAELAAHRRLAARRIGAAAEGGPGAAHGAGEDGARGPGVLRGVGPARDPEGPNRLPLRGERMPGPGSAPGELPKDFESARRELGDEPHRQFHAEALQKPDHTGASEAQGGGDLQGGGLQQPFLDFLAQHLEDRMFLAGQKIIDEANTDDRCMYIIGQGTVQVVKAGVEVALLSSGTVIGEITALGLESKRSASVVAKETCYMQCLHQPVVVRGLELFPADRGKILKVAFKRMGRSMSEVQEDMIEKMAPVGSERSSVRKRIEHFLETLRGSDLLKTAGSEFVEELAGVSTDRIYMPGDCIIEEGKRGASMFVMLSGEAGVYKAGGMVAQLGPGSISGELAMLGVSLIRSTTIKAHVICCMWEIAQEKALPILECYREARNHFKHIILNHLASSVPPLILSLPLFYDFDKKFKTLLGLWCEKRVYFPGTAIVKECSGGDRLCIINLGRAILEKKTVTIRTYDSGSVFGANLMLADPVHKVYLGTLRALHTCHVVMIPRAVYLQALEQYPALSAASRLQQHERVAAEELSQMIRRVCSKKLVWKRYGAILRSASGLAGMSDEEIIARCFRGWMEEADRRRESRIRQTKERAQAEKEMEQWLRKKREAVKRAAKRHEAVGGGGGGGGGRAPAAAADREVSAAELAAFFRQRAKGKGHMKSASPDPYFEEWPEPRPSPFYSLKLWKVLAAAAGEDLPPAAAAAAAA